ncbi:MAG: hypothetical protein IT369_10845 [Candidatus Latescibacteria bacterium]|nr:hypothetical protein [Candidatus Latescibacterota bacterium]
MDETIISFNYRFRMADGTEKEFAVRVEARGLDLVPASRDTYPAWSELGFHQCPNCPLQAEQHPRCPIAANLVDLVDFFKETMSYDEVDVHIETDQREYTKHTSVQQALSSVLGIYMVTSGCPVMDQLRPMVRFHLPFATVEETTYRVISMYLMAQYFRHKRGLRPDWELTGLVPIYEQVQTVNRTFLQRLNHLKGKDANANALVILDSFAGYVTFSLNTDLLDEVEGLFKPYLEE